MNSVSRIVFSVLMSLLVFVPVVAQENTADPQAGAIQPAVVETAPVPAPVTAVPAAAPNVDEQPQNGFRLLEYSQPELTDGRVPGLVFSRPDAIKAEIQDENAAEAGDHSNDSFGLSSNTQDWLAKLLAVVLVLVIVALFMIRNKRRKSRKIFRTIKR